MKKGISKFLVKGSVVIAALAVSNPGIYVRASETEVVQSGPLITPKDIKAAYIQSGEVKLSWPSIEGVKTYGVFRDGDFQGEVVDPTFIDSTIVPTKTYSYQVEARSGDSRSDKSLPFSVTSRGPFLVQKFLTKK
ncbi:hypothetical protein ACTID9_10150 [Brevibacillus fluminis]|uniref:hypothetical protein n=1 Tax=Brevibacillus fluminis TaxID=511487 RepID=UPI003F8BEF0A